MTTAYIHGLSYSSEVASVIHKVQTYGTTLNPTKSVVKKIVGAVCPYWRTGNKTIFVIGVIGKHG